MQDLEFRQLVEQIKLRSPIETIVGERVSELRSRGALLWARCPFHDERTPSFAVDPRKGIWHCYGACGEGGDVIRFVERFDGLTFIDALRLLARGAGIEVPARRFQAGERADEERLEACYEILRRAAVLYARAFRSDEGREAREYARSRGLDDETLELFEVGWAPRDGNPLLEAATRAGVQRERLLDTGLVKCGEDGRVYDFFRGRWMVPIRDRLGRTVGFGGRLLPRDEAREKAAAKYVNTPETLLFHKSRLIFGLDLAAESVRKEKHLVLVEGYTDVMAAHQAGQRNVTAVLGTATTDDHAALVRRSGARRITLLFDADAAGNKASTRALVGLLSLGLELRVATLPPGKDPCDVLVAPGGERVFVDALEQAQDWFSWSLGKLQGLAPALLASAVDELFLLLARLPKPVERSARLTELAQHLGLPETDVRAQWHEHERRSGRPARPRRSSPPPRTPTPAEEQAFALLIGALLLDNSLISLYAERVHDCSNDELREVFSALLRLYDRALDEPIHAGKLLTELGDHPARLRVPGIEDAARRADESAQALARKQELWLERTRQAGEVAELREEFARSMNSFESSSSEEVLRNLHERLRRSRVPQSETSSPRQA